MTTKLTLSINKRVIDKAKKYAKKQGRSLSEVVESLLSAVTNRSATGHEGKLYTIDDDIETLSGFVKMPADFDYKKVLDDALVEKYLK